MSKIQTTVIAVVDNRFPLTDELVEYLAGNCGIQPIENLLIEKNKLTFRSGSATYAVTLLEEKIPTEQLRTPCSLAWHWPEAALEIQKHSCYIIAGVLDETAGAVDVALKLTCLTSAVCVNSGIVPLAVLWTGGKADNKGAPGCVHSPENFVAHSQESSRITLPIELWVSFIPSVVKKNNQFIMTTRGLDAFGIKELETTGWGRSPQWIYEHLFNFAHFYLTHPEDVKENQTIGMSNDEKIDILAASSQLDPNKDVLVLNFDAIETNRQIEEERNKLPGVETELPKAPDSPPDDLPTF